jgi:DNA polymerase V
VLDLVDKHLVTSHVSLYVGYKNNTGSEGGVSVSRKLGAFTNSFERLMGVVDALYCSKVNPARPIRRVNIAFGNLEPEEYTTYTLFTDVQAEESEHARQEALLAIKHKFGKDALMRGTSYKEKARGIERAHQVGGHHA